MFDALSGKHVKKRARIARELAAERATSLLGDSILASAPGKMDTIHKHTVAMNTGLKPHMKRASKPVRMIVQVMADGTQKFIAG